VNTVVGYTGGHTENPTYSQVCSHTTGHAEAVLVEYDPEQITYETLLNIFWNCHNPTQLNRQGPDIGSQYRSVIFYHTTQQQLLAETSKRNLENSGKYNAPIATEIIPANKFFLAEDYHQRYYEKHGTGHCNI
jgi:peptide-methionine (S)-S-oxide reductase